ncbi:hypothetical protein H2201_004685 [Coniosporium apollinis]|uniref:Myb-like domain-containing protein n=2 Tax=Coniosporium TaxID=2810619 RepID=A0ABQ9NW34_9PEZI|nr:hypothetical protein H2199_000631 [Cladosporium sp. JES 115]KAJ9665211.1 hypothetical protein H2201_004685 [Coniosporium apollinis]
MVLHDVDKAWDVLTDNEKRRIFAIWCTQPPATIDWKTVAGALGSSSSEANRVAHFNALKKLRTAGAIVKGNGTPSASAATTPTPTPKKPRAKKAKTDEDGAGNDDTTPKPKSTPKKPRGTKRKAENDGSGDEAGGDGEAPTTPVRKVIKKSVTPAKDEVKADNDD